MAIKVVYRGVPKPLVYKGKCESCSSVLEADTTDLLSSDLRPDMHGPFGTAYCPVCEVAGRPGLYVVFRPKADYDRLKEAKK